MLSNAIDRDLKIHNPFGFTGDALPFRSLFINVYLPFHWSVVDPLRPPYILLAL